MDKIIFIPKELVLSIHNFLVLDAIGFCNQSNFEFMFSEINSFLKISQKLSSKEILVKISSLYFFHIISGHSFNDGNKRTAFLTVTIFLLLNNYSTKYNEEKVDVYLKQINSKLEKGGKTSIVLTELEKNISETSEFKLIKLLFDLAAFQGEIVYNSHEKIIPILENLIVSGLEKQFLPGKSFCLNAFKKAVEFFKK